MIAVIDHQPAALARLAQFLKGKTNVAAVFAALNNRAQEVEVALQALLTERSVSTAIGTQLDQLGAIVGQIRGNATDDGYRLLIHARIKINNSSGTGPELLDVFSGLTLPGMPIRIRDEPPAAFTLVIEDLVTTADALTFILILRSMKTAGVRALLEYGPQATNETFTFDTADLGFDGGTFGDSYFRGTLI